MRDLLQTLETGLDRRVHLLYHGLNLRVELLLLLDLRLQTPNQVLAQLVLSHRVQQSDYIHGRPFHLVRKLAKDKQPSSLSTSLDLHSADRWF